MAMALGTNFVFFGGAVMKQSAFYLLTLRKEDLKIAVMTDTLFNLRLDDDDRALLEACATREKLSKSDIVRRAIRAYALSIGVDLETKRKQRNR